MASSDDAFDALKFYAFLSLRTGIPVPDLLDTEEAIIDAYRAVLADEAEANNRKE